MTIEIKEKMTKEEFLKKWEPHEFASINRMMESDLNELLGEPEETVEYPCLLITSEGNLIYLKNTSIDVLAGKRNYECYLLTEVRGTVLQITKLENFVLKDCKPFHGEIIFKQ